MISLRYHALSLAAVFLALALGVVLGASGVSDRLLSAITTERDDLGGRVQQLTSERDGLAAAQRSSEEFAQRVGPNTVRGVLQGQNVVIVTSGADVGDRDAVAALLRQAGASVAGEVALTPAAVDPARADQFRELVARLLPPGAQLPAASDTGSLAGGLLAGVLLAPNATPDRAQAVFSGLAAAGFVRPGDVPARANLALVLTGGALTGVDAADGAAVLARMAAEIDRSSAGAVLAGRSGSADATGAVGVARADPTISSALSTVDDVHSRAGQISAVLALREQADGRAGRYGTDVTAADGSAPGV
ncbi:copper transporter [Pseudonocardia sp. TRM90224]|uniref:copper transporter n=1 Tax=Pseudonocardia sp. TRM90224 TaxID=2812678 RepID=UPI001E2FD70C|nr:copper transporter [Pseudonocardia sp. TRM90224]